MVAISQPLVSSRRRLVGNAGGSSRVGAVSVHHAEAPIQDLPGTDAISRL